MTVVVPRLAREDAVELVARHASLPISEVGAAMPATPPTITYSPVGGIRVETAQLEDLRRKVVDLAIAAGMPGQSGRDELQRFEGEAARIIHSALPMTPHEASTEEVWSYLTCCWLLDVALWRFGPKNMDRFIGHLNRNTFRRMWWRAEIFGPDIDLTALGEDELVNIMERPTLFSDRPLARAIAAEFLERVERGQVPDRMRLMREATKRLLRLTPFLSFAAMPPDTLSSVVADAFDAAQSGLEGDVVTLPVRARSEAPLPSADVTAVPALAVDASSTSVTDADWEEVLAAALDIVRRTGRVTNIALREVVPIGSDDARDALMTLVGRGDLVRRGVRRGTHYVFPDAVAEPEPEVEVAPEPVPESRLNAPPASVPGERAPESSLRRLLRRRG